jgi:hypothetical protein
MRRFRLAARPRAVRWLVVATLAAALWLAGAGCDSKNSGTPEKVGPAPKSRTPQ